MSKAGFVLIYRSVTDSPDWLAEPFTRGQAWVDLLMLANHKEGYIRKAGQKISIKRGQCGWSEKKLAERWQWSRGKVRRFIDELVDGERVSKETNTRTTMLTICNYNKYQRPNKPDSTTDRTTDGHQIEQQTDTNKEEINNNKINIPACVREEDLNDFIAFRKQIKKPMSELAITRLLNKLESLNAKGHDPQKVISRSILNNWQDVYELPADEQVKPKRQQVGEWNV